MAPDASGTADRRGSFTTTARTCSPLTLASSTPADWEETVPTYVQHVALDWGHIGVTSVSLPSVGVSTAKIIPALLGVAWTEGSGMVVGRVVGCDGAPVGKAQAYTHDGRGAAPADEEVFYFERDLPSSTASFTSVDDGTVLMRNMRLEVGSAPVTVLADAVAFVTAVVGREDGVRYPDICFAACDEID